MEDLLEPILGLVAAAFGLLAYVTWLFVRALVAPVRFAVSSGYRRKVLAGWQERRWLPWVQVPAVIFVMAVLAFLIPFWAGFFRSATTSDAERWAKKSLIERSRERLQRIKEAAAERIRPQP